MPSGSDLPNAHTLLLVQYRQGQESRSYGEHETVPGALDSICQMYEQALKLQVSSPEETVKYTLEELIDFVDGLHDIACLVFDSRLQAYVPHNREWIRSKLLKYLQSQLSEPATGPPPAQDPSSPQ